MVRSRDLCAALCLTVMLPACTPEKVAAVQSAISAACQAALIMTKTPVASGLAPYVQGCDSAIARLALDPASLAWLNDIIAKAKALGA